MKSAAMHSEVRCRNVGFEPKPLPTSMSLHEVSLMPRVENVYPKVGTAESQLLRRRHDRIPSGLVSIDGNHSTREKQAAGHHHDQTPSEVLDVRHGFVSQYSVRLPNARLYLEGHKDLDLYLFPAVIGILVAMKNAMRLVTPENEVPQA
jgi:hypothetical protein